MRNVLWPSAMTRGLAPTVVMALCCGASVWAIYTGAFSGSSQWAFAKSGMLGTPAYPIRIELPPQNSPQRPEKSISLTETATAETSVEKLGSAEPQVNSASVLGGNSPVEAAAVRPSFVELDFDIAELQRVAVSDSRQTVRAPKALRLDGVEVGAIQLVFGQGSTVSADRQALQSLASKDAALSSAIADLDGEFVSFDALRDRGVSIRYDALDDTVIVDGRD